MSTQLSKRGTFIWLAICTASVLPAFFHVSWSMAVEPFYGPPTLSEMVAFVALPCIYIVAACITVVASITLTYLEQQNWLLLLSALPLVLGCSMVIDSMNEYSGDQYRQFNENQAYLEDLEAQLEQATADPPNHRLQLTGDARDGL